jgi:hypothetical protein
MRRDLPLVNTGEIIEMPKLHRSSRGLRPSPTKADQKRTEGWTTSEEMLEIKKVKVEVSGSANP